MGLDSTPIAPTQDSSPILALMFSPLLTPLGNALLFPENSFIFVKMSNIIIEI